MKITTNYTADVIFGLSTEISFDYKIFSEVTSDLAGRPILELSCGGAIRYTILDMDITDDFVSLYIKNY